MTNRPGENRPKQQPADVLFDLMADIMYAEEFVLPDVLTMRLSRDVNPMYPHWHVFVNFKGALHMKTYVNEETARVHYTRCKGEILVNMLSDVPINIEEIL